MQVPQYILEEAWGSGRAVRIMCIQPRRISAMSVAERVAQARARMLCLHQASQQCCVTSHGFILPDAGCMQGNTAMKSARWEGFIAVIVLFVRPDDCAV